MTLGRHGEMPCEQARKEAALAIDRIKRGEEPFPGPPPKEPTLSDLAERFMGAHVKQHCRPSTAAGYRAILEKHVLPELGTTPLTGTGRAGGRRTPPPVARHARACERGGGPALADVRARRGVGVAPSRAQPLPGVQALQDAQAERFLSEEEYQRLGEALMEAEAEGAWGPR